MLRPLFMGLIPVLMTTCLLAQIPATPIAPVSSRLAVISTADTADMAALVTTELSANTDITLVERDDLAKVGDELKLQQLAGSDAAALGKLVNADGILFLGKTGDDLHARLTAVGLGYSVFDLQIAPGIDPNELAKSLSHRVEQFAPKLKLTITRAIPISILNLRSDLSSPNSTKVERDLTLLLESRLASIPEYVVLERRHAWDLGFEHSLITSSAPQLLEGAYVLDGSLRIAEAAGGDIHAQLRLRAPKTNEETPLLVGGRVDDLPGMVEAMVAQIEKTVGSPASPSSWQPQAEAREYLHEGIWAWEHGQPQAAIEALDSAELLGETAPDLLAARIEALCQLAVPDLNPAEIELMGDPGAMATVFLHANPTHYYVPLLPLADRLALARRAIADLGVYTEPAGLRSYHLQFLDPKWQHAVQLSYSRRFVIHAASKILAELDQQGDPEAGPFREEVRDLAHFDPLNGKLPDDQGDAAFFTDDWAHSLDEETAYYRQVLSAAGTENQLKAVFLKDRFIDERGTVFCPRFIKDPAEQKKAFVQFAQSLELTPEGKLAGLLILSNGTDRALGEASYAAFLDELDNQRVELVQTNELFAHCLPAYDLYQRFSQLRNKTGDRAVPILRYFLTHSNRWDIRTLQVLWVPDGFPAADAPAIWSEYKAYKARILDPAGSTGSYAFQEEAMFGAFESAFSTAFPETVETPKNPLRVTRFWQPGTEANVPFFCIRTCVARGNTVAVEGMSPGRIEKIYLLQPPNFASEPVIVPPDVFPFGLDVTPEAIYMTGMPRDPTTGTNHPDSPWHLYRFDRSLQTWDRQEISLSFSTPRIVRDKLFLTISSGNGQHGAIARYDWPTQTMTLLSSDRRRPAQNQFDDRTGYQVLSLFPGLDHTIGTNIDFKCFTISETPGTWSELIPGFGAQRANLVGNKTLVEDYRGKICVLLDPEKQHPEVLLASLGAGLPAALAPFGTARWQLDPTIILKILDAAKGLRNDALFAMIQHHTAPRHCEIVWLDSAHSQPVHIPLQFCMDPSIQALMRNQKGQPVNTVNAIDPALDSFPLQMVTTDAGICLYHPSAGIWFIPYADIEAYLNSVRK